MLHFLILWIGFLLGFMTCSLFAAIKKDNK